MVNIPKFGTKLKIMISENIQVKIEKNARIMHLKSETKRNTKLLIALHGYGQLATYFSRKFEQIHPDFDVLIPEALNRFYLKGSSGRVGASWMTKEERESDIEDNQNYLSQLFSKYEPHYKQIILLGFSQGGATAARFCYRNKITISGLILWASVFPPDVNQESISLFEGEKYFVLGDNDEFFNEESQKEALDLQTNLGYTNVYFEGKHDVDISVLNAILSKFK